MASSDEAVGSDRPAWGALPAEQTPQHASTAPGPAHAGSHDAGRAWGQPPLGPGFAPAMLPPEYFVQQQALHAAWWSGLHGGPPPPPSFLPGPPLPFLPGAPGAGGAPFGAAPPGAPHLPPWAPACPPAPGSPPAQLQARDATGSDGTEGTEPLPALPQPGRVPGAARALAPGATRGSWPAPDPLGTSGEDDRGRSDAGRAWGHAHGAGRARRGERGLHAPLPQQPNGGVPSGWAPPQRAAPARVHARLGRPPSRSSQESLECGSAAAQSIRINLAEAAQRNISTERDLAAPAMSLLTET